MREFYRPGDWNAICDVCGFKFKASALTKRWDGLMTCSKDFEFRNPQDFIKIPKERIAPPWTRPEVVDVFVSMDLITESSDALITESGDNLVW